MVTEMVRPKIKRKQYLVAKKFQLKYVGIILALMFLTAALCSYVIYYTSMILMGEKLANVYPQGRLVHIVKIVNFRIMLSVLLVTPLVALIGIFLSHRIAGPIYRMERFMDSLAAGDLGSRIYLRQGDELITVANSINRLADSFEATVRDQKSRLNKLSGELDNLIKTQASRPHDISIAINRLEEELKGIIKKLDKYKA